MWSRKLILATLVAAAAVTLARHGPTAHAPGLASASPLSATSFR